MPDDEAVRRAAAAAGVPLARSLAPWGVTEGRVLLDRGERPVVHLRVSTEIQRVLLEAQIWLLPQVRVLLARVGVPPTDLMAARLVISSAEADAQLFEEE